MTGSGRPLAGRFVGLSISEGADSARLGFPAPQVGLITVRLAEAMLEQGVGLVFGHDWRPDGIMHAVYDLSRRASERTRLTRNSSAAPLLQNVVPWPDAPALLEAQSAARAGTLQVEQGGLPDELAPHGSVAQRGSPRYQYLRARGLTHLRRRLNERVDARICLGGRLKGSGGRYPGVVEEALLSVESGLPLYLSCMLGGAAAALVDALEGRPMPDGFCDKPDIARLYDTPPDGMRERNSATAADRTFDPAAVWQRFARLGVAGLSDRNGLTVEQNLRLFNARADDVVANLVLVGLGRTKPRPRERVVLAVDDEDTVT